MCSSDLVGYKYEGWFKDWRYHNRGVFTWSNGDKYEGEFKKGEKHGQGIYIQSEGRKYVGEYKNGLKNGLGTLTYGKGKWEGLQKIDFAQGNVKPSLWNRKPTPPEKKVKRKKK